MWVVRVAQLSGDIEECRDVTDNLRTVSWWYLDEGELGELMDIRAARAESGGITEAHAAYSAGWGTRRPSFSSWRTAP